MTRQQNGRRVNYLRTVLAVQEFYQTVKVEGQPDIFVYRKHIYPIALSTFRMYLQIPAKKLLREIGAEISNH